MATRFLPLTKYVSCTLTYSDKHLSLISQKLIKDCAKSSQPKICTHFCPSFMPLPWQRIFGYCRKMHLSYLQPKVHICAKFHGNWSKTEEVVRDARFALDQPPDRLIPIQCMYTPFKLCMPMVHNVYTNKYTHVCIHNMHMITATLTSHWQAANFCM